jgi:hypothetical protein
MTQYQFSILSEEEQVAVLDQSGVQIGERPDLFYHIILYAIDSFYVEVYHHAHFNVPVRISSFTNVALLDPYLELMDIEFHA